MVDQDRPTGVRKGCGQGCFRCCPLRPATRGATRRLCAAPLGPLTQRCRCRISCTKNGLIEHQVAHACVLRARLWLGAEHETDMRFGLGDSAGSVDSALGRSSIEGWPGVAGSCPPSVAKAARGIVTSAIAQGAVCADTPCHVPSGTVVHEQAGVRVLSRPRPPASGPSNFGSRRQVALDSRSDVGHGFRPLPR